MSNYTSISIEKIATGTIADIPCFGAAEIYGVQFEGDSYSVTFCTNPAGGWDSLDITTINAGEMVDCFNGQTFLRAEKDISDEERRAKIDALDASIAAMTAKLPAIHADTAAMQAEMFVAPAMIAAE